MMANQSRFSLIQTPMPPRPVAQPNPLAPNLVQFQGTPLCPICEAGPATIAQLTQDLLESDAPDIPALAKRYDVRMKDLLQHIYDCMAADPYLSRSQVNDAASRFAEEVVTALARTMSRAEQILNELFDEALTDDNGKTVYPNRTINLALAYNQVAKTHAATLDGVVAASQRKQITQRLEQIEQAQTQTKTISISAQTNPVSAQTKPQRSIAQILAMSPYIDPLS